jgi:hypothetical protein
MLFAQSVKYEGFADRTYLLVFLFILSSTILIFGGSVVGVIVFKKTTVYISLKDGLQMSKHVVM